MLYMHQYITKYVTNNTNNMTRNEKIHYLIQNSPCAEPPEFFNSWTDEDLDAEISIHDKAVALGAGAPATKEQQSNALKTAIAVLLADHPEFEEQNSTGWDMIEALKDLWNELVAAVVP